MCRSRPRPAIWLSIASVLVAITLAAPRPAAAQDAAPTVVYHTGWNLLGAPTGTDLSRAQGPAFALGPGSVGYQTVGPGELVGGRGVWVYFPQDTTIALGRTAAEYSRVIAPPGQYIIVGNPSATETVPVSGADTVLTYDPVAGYQPTDHLAPGQAALVLSNTGGAVTLGRIAADEETDAVLRLQMTLTQQPTDRSTIDQLGATAAELVRQRRYGDVQAVLDDVRAAEEDGVRLAGGAPLPPLTPLQQNTAIAVREDVARAKTAAAAGDLAQADAAIDVARRSAQAAAAEGLSVAKGPAGPNSLDYTGTGRATQSSGLTAFGALIRSAFFATGLGQPPGDDFWRVATTVLGTPGSPTPSPTPAATPTATPPSNPCAQGCSFSGDATATMSAPVPPTPNGGRGGTAMLTSMIKFQISVVNSQVTGQGTFSTTYLFGGGLNCSVPMQTGPIYVSGVLTTDATGTRYQLTLSFSQTPDGSRPVTTPFPCEDVPIGRTITRLANGYTAVVVDAQDGATAQAGPPPNGDPTIMAKITVTLHGGR